MKPKQLAVAAVGAILAASVSYVGAQPPPPKKATPAPGKSKAASPITTSPTFVCTEPAECVTVVTVGFVGGQCVVQVFPEHLGVLKGNKNVKVRVRLENSKGWEFTTDGATFKQPNTVFTKVGNSKKHWLWTDKNDGPGTYAYSLKFVRPSDGQICEADPSYINDTPDPQ